VGAGRNGRVYRATWRRPASVLASTRQEEGNVEVVVKVLMSGDTVKRFAQEVSTWSRGRVATRETCDEGELG
jgi:hypothetical protein